MDQQELINDYLDGKLSPKDKKLFENLLADNPKYKVELERQRRLKENLVSSKTESPAIPSDEDETNFSQFNLKSWLFATAIALVLVLLGYFLWTTLSKSPGERLYSEYYETFPHEANRSPDGNASEFTSQAFQAYDKRDFETAAGWFEQAQTQPNSDYTLLYLGICYLEMERPEKAIPVLNRIPDNSKTASKEIASWYEALGYFKLNMLEKAKHPLKITTASPNPFQDEAKKILEILK